MTPPVAPTSSRAAAGTSASPLRGRRGRWPWLLAGLLLLAALFVFTLPPRPRSTHPGPATPPAAPATARGAYHIHTTRSDGSGTVDEVAAAAARAGLQFIIVTDHGDGTRPPLAPAYRSGVLVIDAVEISTEGGHYAALGLSAPAPYRVAGEPRDVVEDVRRLGGFGIAAHPTSRKPELRWTGWETPFDGVEWLNVDTEWRDESRLALLLALARYPFRSEETLASLFSHERDVLDRWDALAPRRRVVGMAAVDAHARIGVAERRESSYMGLATLRVPSYESLFRTFSLHVELPRRLTGDAREDAQAVLAAVREGHLYTVVDALATPGAVRFEASVGDTRARMGDFLAPNGLPISWRVSADAPERESFGASSGNGSGAGSVGGGVGGGGGGASRGATMRLLCDGKVVAEAPASTLLKYEQPANAALPGACRVEIGWDLEGRRALWLVTNPIYLRPGDPPLPAPGTSIFPAPRESWPLAVGSSADWRVEHDSGSDGRVTIETIDASASAAGAGTGAHGAATHGAAAEAVTPGAASADVVRFDFHLRDGSRSAQYAAAVTARVEHLAQSARLRFRASAARPMRLSVQLRDPGDETGTRASLRWRRSIYLDETPREYAIAWEDMSPIAGEPAGASPAHPPLDQIHALLFVIDTLNTAPGAAGWVRLEQLRVER
jgi:uncharacterized membrane protein YgcG